MGVSASQITCLSIVYATVCSGADQRKHQSSAWLAFVRGIHHLMTSSWVADVTCAARFNSISTHFWAQLENIAKIIPFLQTPLLIMITRSWLIIEKATVSYFTKEVYPSYYNGGLNKLGLTSLIKKAQVTNGVGRLNCQFYWIKNHSAIWVSGAHFSLQIVAVVLWFQREV